MPPPQNARLRIICEKRKIIVKSFIIMIWSWSYHQSKAYHLLYHVSHELWVMMTHHYLEMTHKVMKWPKSLQNKLHSFLKSYFISNGQPTSAWHHKSHESWLMVSHKNRKMTKQAMKTPETPEKQSASVFYVISLSDGQPTHTSYFMSHESWPIVSHKNREMTINARNAHKTKCIHFLCYFYIHRTAYICVMSWIYQLRLMMTN